MTRWIRHQTFHSVSNSTFTGTYQVVKEKLRNSYIFSSKNLCTNQIGETLKNCTIYIIIIILHVCKMIITFVYTNNDIQFKTHH